MHQSKHENKNYASEYTEHVTVQHGKSQHIHHSFSAPGVRSHYSSMSQVFRNFPLGVNNNQRYCKGYIVSNCKYNMA